MPVSRVRKKKRSSRRSGPGRGYLAASSGLSTPVLDDSQADLEALDERLRSISPRSLVSVGFAEWYLSTGPIRIPNQCAIAAYVIERAIQYLGLDAAPVGLILRVPGKEYGHIAPHMDGWQVVGHIGLIADGHFVDMTAFQFPEVYAHGGVRVIAAEIPSPETEHEIRRQGANVPARLIDGYEMEYLILPEGATDVVMDVIDDMYGYWLTYLSGEILARFIFYLSQSGLLERIEALGEAKYQRLLEVAGGMAGMDVAEIHLDQFMPVDD